VVTSADVVATHAEIPAAPGDATSLPGLLLHHATSTPHNVAFRHKQLGVWAEGTYADYARRATAVGVGLASLGVDAGDRVAIHSENRPEWLLSDIGAQGIGAISVGVYPTSPATEVEYLLSHSGAKVLIAEDEEQLDKAMAVREKLIDLRHIVVIDTRGVRVLDDPMVITFAELEARGAAEDVQSWNDRVASIDPGACAVIVYTSGTTGPPKGAMLSHRNLVAAANTIAATYSYSPEDEVLSYLPLCHVAERLFSTIAALHAGYVVNFGEGGDELTKDLREVQPTILLGVPRVWERMLAAVEIRMNDASRLKRGVFKLARRLGTAASARRLKGDNGVVARIAGGLAWLLAFRALRQKLGLGRVNVPLSGAAPVAPQVLEFFWAMGVQIREGYGQTEDTALCTYTPDDDVRLGTVGRPLPGVEIKIAPDGEILTRSDGVFLGYYRNPEATSETVDAEGWLHTGDVGELDGDGFLTITDRKKDIIITSGGKNISPSEIENRVKVSPWVREAVVIGDQRKYLTALIGVEPDTVGDWAIRQGIPVTTYRDLSAKEEVRELIAEWIKVVNEELAQVETIKEFRLIPKELDHEEGQLTATQKVKRRAIEDEFRELIEEMYR
jgi:long-chain acyl-CoA synthetase